MARSSVDGQATDCAVSRCYASAIPAGAEVVDELTAVGVEFARCHEFERDAEGITARARGGRIAWFQDPDGNTFAIEADA